MSTPEFKPSKLGTKEYWDSVYEEELNNFNDTGDEGEVWFGMETVEKMVDWIQDNIPSSSNPAVLEVGSGNGILLISLVEAGYSAKQLSGLDYSPDATALARAVARQRSAEDILFITGDFLQNDPPPLANPFSPQGTPPQWDLILDKGTFDAIALSVKDENGKSPAAQYPARVKHLLRPGGYFLITSCNFTEEELKAEFVTEATGLVYQ
ncbi:hypothetical protein AX16_002652 [Volvariella volvacea WC 439]|nr:hypothetical protein AX16_002652 [Volvariella volvacea WC 439]